MHFMQVLADAALPSFLSVCPGWFALKKYDANNVAVLINNKVEKRIAYFTGHLFVVCRLDSSVQSTWHPAECAAVQPLHMSESSTV